MPKVKVPRLCSRSQPGIKVIIRDLRGHLLHTVTFLVFFREDTILKELHCPGKQTGNHKSCFPL